jgi:hypothetical protein
MKSKVLLVLLNILVLAFSLGSLLGAQQIANLALMENTPEETLVKVVRASECIRIYVDASDASWEKFANFFALASLHGREVILQSGIRALSLTSTRAWRKNVTYQVVGSEKNNLEPDPQNTKLIECRFDQDGREFVGKDNTSVEKYLEANPDEKFVLVCSFEKKSKLKINSDILLKLAELDGIIDFAFPQN